MVDRNCLLSIETQQRTVIHCITIAASCTLRKFIRILQQVNTKVGLQLQCVLIFRINHRQSIEELRPDSAQKICNEIAAVGITAQIQPLTCEIVESPDSTMTVVTHHDMVVTAVIQCIGNMSNVVICKIGRIMDRLLHIT